MRAGRTLVSLSLREAHRVGMRRLFMIPPSLARLIQKERDGERVFS